MAKKSKKIEKETRQLMESVTDCVKRKGDRYKFKSKNKKMVKRVKKSCVHWIFRKGKETPTTEPDPNRPGYWRCTICNKSFPIVPDEYGDYVASAEHLLGYVNQMQFWAVKLGGDADDTKMFQSLKTNIPKFEKASKQILKRVNQRQQWEKNRENSDSMSQFGMYSAFQYK